MAAIDWRFMQPLDQSNQIAAMAAGNNQINTGLAAMGNAVTGYADALKQRNTDSILNALYQAQTTADLPNAMSAVQALQQQYGRGFDQAAVRNAIDTRGSTLGQRDLQAINLQQAQNAQAAIPQINALNAARMQQAGATPEQMSALSAIQGIDTSALAQQQIGDLRDTRDFNYKQNIDTRNYNRQVLRDQVGDRQWEAGNQRANYSTAAQLASMYEQPAQSGWTTDAQGNPVPYQSSGVTKGDAFGAIMGSLFNTESGGRHTDSNGNLTRSPKGALGVAQIMPATAAKPGYGMKSIDLKNTSPQEQMQWANEYINRISQKEGFTIEQGVAAYNAGPGAVKEAIRSGGSNWLSKLPAETRAYVPKVMGGAGQAMNAVGGRGITQANMSKVTSDYQSALAKLNADYASQEAKSQVKGSLASTGNSVETWAASNRGKDNTFFTNAGDLAKMARQDPTFNKLPESAQINVLNGAFAKMNDVNALQYVPDADLKKFISREATNYKQDRVNQFEGQKQALMEQAYQGIVAQYQAVGQQPPTREGVRQILDPQTPKPQAPKPQPVPTKQSTPPPQTAPKQQTPSKMDTYMAQREAKKQAQRDAVDKRLTAEKTKKQAQQASQKMPNGTVRIGSTNMSQKQLDDILKKYKVS
ncbi:putative tail withlytic transglycosylase [Acinetobacter phage nACB1]|nr:putative tail withlytic transglycosylase [Acinetobacter phage nACB1]